MEKLKQVGTTYTDDELYDIVEKEFVIGMVKKIVKDCKPSLSEFETSGLAAELAEKSVWSHIRSGSLIKARLLSERNSLVEEFNQRYLLRKSWEDGGKL